MKKYRIILISFLMLGMAGSYYAGEKKSSYTPKVLLDKKWGYKTGDLSGIIEGEEGDVPNHFCVDSEGNMYVTNCIIEPRIMKYSPEGHC